MCPHRQRHAVNRSRNADVSAQKGQIKSHDLEQHQGDDGFGLSAEAGSSREFALRWRAQEAQEEGLLTVSRIIFLAAQKDAVTATTIYGKDHQVDLTDEVLVRLWNNQGKVALMGADPRQVRVSPIGTTTATVNWIVDQTVTSTRVEYGLTTSYGTNVNGSPLTGGGAVTANLTGLTTATLYHYRIQTVQGGFTSYSPDLTFTTA
jgi:hypothetical protein